MYIYYITCCTWGEPNIFTHKNNLYLTWKICEEDISITAEIVHKEFRQIMDHFLVDEVEAKIDGSFSEGKNAENRILGWVCVLLLLNP